MVILLVETKFHGHLMVISHTECCKTIFSKLKQSLLRKDKVAKEINGLIKEWIPFD